MLLILSVTWVAVIALLIGRAVSQYGAYQQLTPAQPPPDDWTTPRDWPTLTVIAPARNEARNIGGFLTRLSAQDYPSEKLRVIVVDDNSTDATGSIAREIAAQDTRVVVLQGAPLPDGWKGKPHACWQAANLAEETRGQSGAAIADVPGAESKNEEWLCFIDCDTRPEPGLLRCAVGRAQRDGLDMLSLEPFQLLGTFWERVIFPAGFLLLAFSQDLRRVNNPALPDAFANGQFILIRRRVYDAIGGHERTRTWFAEDTALARAVKSAGFRLAVLGAEKLISTRMYCGLAELWEGLAKVLIEMVGGQRKTIFFAAFGVVLAAATLALPTWGWIAAAHGGFHSGVLIPAILATAASLALFGVHIGCAVYLRIPFWYGLLFPIGYLAGAPLAAYSIWTRAAGRIAWKGRVYASAQTEA